MPDSYFANPFPSTGLNVQQPNVDQDVIGQMIQSNMRRQALADKQGQLPVIGGAQLDPFSQFTGIADGQFSKVESDRGLPTMQQIQAMQFKNAQPKGNSYFGLDGYR